MVNGTDLLERKYEREIKLMVIYMYKKRTKPPAVPVMSLDLSWMVRLILVRVVGVGEGSGLVDK